MTLKNAIAGKRTAGLNPINLQSIIDSAKPGSESISKFVHGTVILEQGKPHLVVRMISGKLLAFSNADCESALREIRTNTEKDSLMDLIDDGYLIRNGSRKELRCSIEEFSLRDQRDLADLLSTHCLDLGEKQKTRTYRTVPKQAVAKAQDAKPAGEKKAEEIGVSRFTCTPRENGHYLITSIFGTTLRGEKPKALSSE